MAASTYNGINLDLGHFLVGQKTSPIPFLTKYHEHVTHVHVKDRKYDGATVPFGQGDVPIVEVLQLIKKNKWKIQATIEYEYPLPAGSDTLTELTKCVEYLPQSPLVSKAKFLHCDDLAAVTLGNSPRSVNFGFFEHG